MNHRILSAAVVLLSLAACDKTLPGTPQEFRELSFTASSDAMTTKGYTESVDFYETTLSELHGASKTPTPRTMLMSSYLTPQSGTPSPYFTGNTFSYSGEGNIWWNTVDGVHEPIYWPVGGTLDFLAVSLSAVDSHGITCVWNSVNPSAEVSFEVSAENTQNDILFASSSGVMSSAGSEPLNLTFSHAQAWLEFALTGSGAEAIHFKEIRIANAYNAGTLDVKNNYGNAVALWEFSVQTRADFKVDDIFNVSSLANLSGELQYLDMLIPQQSRTPFTVYYSVGDDPTVLSRTVNPGTGTWLMGNCYVYRINISSTAISISSSSSSWE